MNFGGSVDSVRHNWVLNTSDEGCVFAFFFFFFFFFFHSFPPNNGPECTSQLWVIQPCPTKFTMGWLM